MGRYNFHPAQGGGHYHDEKISKNHQPTFEQIKERQRLKKLKKKRNRGR